MRDGQWSTDIGSDLDGGGRVACQGQSVQE